MYAFQRAFIEYRSFNRSRDIEDKFRKIQVKFLENLGIFLGEGIKLQKKFKKKN